MNRVTEDLVRFRLYIDDAVVFNPEPAFHVTAIHDFLAFLRLHHVELSPKRARLGSTSIDILGHAITPAGLHHTTAKAAAPSQTPMPTEASHLQSVRGGKSSYRRLLPDLSKGLRPLHRFLKENIPFLYSLEMAVLVRAMLTQPPVLAVSDWDNVTNGSRLF